MVKMKQKPEQSDVRNLKRKYKENIKGLLLLLNNYINYFYYFVMISFKEKMTIFNMAHSCLRNGSNNQNELIIILFQLPSMLHYFAFKEIKIFRMIGYFIVLYRNGS